MKKNYMMNANDVASELGVSKGGKMLGRCNATIGKAKMGTEIMKK